IDFFDDEIETLRTFDPQTQRTRKETDAVRVLPAREFPFDPDAIKGFRQRFRASIKADPTQSTLYRDISEAQLPAGSEYYLPLFFDETVSLLVCLGAEGEGAGPVILGDYTTPGLEAGWRMIEVRYAQLSGFLERLVLVPVLWFFHPSVVIDVLAMLLSL